MTTAPDCYKCVHRRQCIGSAHSRCNNVGTTVAGAAQGIRRGWFIWPLNFDPTWLEACNGWSDKAEDNKPDVKHDPLVEIMAIFGSVGRAFPLGRA